MDKKLNISISTVIWVVTLIFAAGGAYIKSQYQEAEIKALEEKVQSQWRLLNEKATKEDIKTLEERLDKKIELIKQNRKRIEELEKYRAWEEGKQSVLEEYNNE